MSTVAIKNQNMVEVYSNDDGQIVIKYHDREREGHVIFWPEFADALIAAIQKEMAALAAEIAEASEKSLS